MSAQSPEVDAYIAAQPEAARGRLEEMRTLIRGAAPEAEEIFGYKMPGYRHHGGLVYFSGWKNHCALYGIGEALIEAHREALQPYGQSGKGTIRFPLDEPLPRALITGLVAARVAENEANARPARRGKVGASGVVA